MPPLSPSAVDEYEENFVDTLIMLVLESMLESQQDISVIKTEASANLIEVSFKLKRQTVSEGRKFGQAMHTLGKHPPLTASLVPPSGHSGD